MTKRRPDILGLALGFGLAAALMGGGFSLVMSGLIKGWELAAILIGGGVLVAAARPQRHSTPQRNTHVHGSARPAPEPEAQSAARGTPKTAPYRDQTFPD